MKTLSGRLLYVYLSVTLAVPSVGWSQESGYTPSPIPGVTLISPEDFFLNKAPDIDLEKTIPEIKEINAMEYRDLERFSWDLAKRGVTMGVGSNNNFQNFFDLYGSYVITNPVEPEAQFGFTLRSKVGRLHFPTHDASHLYIGQIGPRSKDLKDIKNSKKRLMQVLMDIEGLASAWTSWYHVKRYWNWRNETIEGHDKELFRKYNNGIYFMGPMPLADFADMLMSQNRGDMLTFYKTTRRNVDVDYYLDLKAAKVPLLIEDLEPKLGPTLERLVLKYGTAIGSALSSYFREKTGFLAFKSYAKIQADFYYQPWYVDWAERFQVGEDLESLEKEIAKKVTAFKVGKFTDEVTKPHKGVYETMQMRTEVTHFGRKLVEFIHLSKESAAQGVVNETDVKDIQRLLSEVEALNARLLKLGRADKEVSISDIQTQKSDFERLLQTAERRFDINRMIPLKLRVAHASYQNFWRDPVAIVMPRPPALTSFMSGSTILNKAREIRMEKEKAEMKGKKYSMDVKLLPNIIGELEKNLALEYLESRKGQGTVVAMDSDSPYINKVNTFRAAFNQQIERVFLPQVLEMSQLDFKERETIINLSQAVQEELNKQIDDLVLKYRKVFIDLDRDRDLKKSLLLVEGNVAVATHTILKDFAEILDTLDEGKKLKAVKREMADLQSHIDQFKAGKEINLSFVEEFLRVKIPFKGKTVSSACSYITKFCIKNEKISEALGARYLEESFLRPDTEFKIQASDQIRAQIAKLPSNAVVMILPNHDYGILDGRIVSQISEAVGLQRTMVLTNKEAYPHLKIRELNDRDVFFSQDRFFEPMLEEMKTFSEGRIGMGYFPEGVIQYWNSQFPRTAKWGAFAYARRAANALKGKKPVYLLQIQTNGLEHVTSKEKVDYKATVVKMTLVPDYAVSSADKWVVEARSQFEADVNRTRAQQQVDLIDRGTRRKTNVRNTAPVRDYVSVEDFLNKVAEPLPGMGSRCQKAF